MPRSFLQSKLLGNYIPSFFYMVINTEGLDIKMMDEEARSTFIHEYIHFLQDVSTAYGLANICKTSDHIKALAFNMNESKNSVIKLPVKIDNFESVETNIELFTCYHGQINDFKLNDKTKVIDIRYIPNDIIIGYEQVCEVYVDLGVQDNKTGEYVFGSGAIMENIAILIEDGINDKSTDAPELPYRLAEMVAEFLYKEFSENKLYVLALCEVCLMFYHSAEVFCTILMMMYQEKFSPNNVTDIYSYVIDNVHIESNDGLDNHKLRLKKLESDSTKAISDLFTIEIFKDAVEWGKSIITNAIQIREGQPLLFSNIYQLSIQNRDKREVLDFISMLLDKIGCPQVFDKSGNGYLIGQSSNNALLYRAIYELYNMVTLPFRTECGLQQFCNMSSKVSIITNYCQKKPWLNARKEILCPLGQILKMWGLHEKDFDILMKLHKDF